MLAIIVGAVLYMVYGGVYYSILLSDKNKEVNQDFLKNQSEGPVKYVAAVVIAIISSYLVAIFTHLTGAENLLQGLTIGFMIGLIIVFVYLKNMLFGLMSKRSFLIAIGDHLVIFTILGALHGLLS